MILMLVGNGTDEDPPKINPNPFDFKGKSEEVLVSCNSYSPVWQDITACPGVRAASAASGVPVHVLTAPQTQAERTMMSEESFLHATLSRALALAATALTASVESGQNAF